MQATASFAIASLRCYPAALMIGYPRPGASPLCPIDSPWDIETPAPHKLDDLNASMNLDDFIPLDELLEVSLQSLDSTCSDRTEFQVQP